MPALSPISERDPEPTAAALQPAARRRRQCHRLIGGVLASYAVDTALLLAFAHFGAMPAELAWAYAAAGVAACGAFAGLLRTRFVERLADPFLVVPQMLVHSIITLAAAMAAPSVGVPLLMMLLIVHAFGAMRVAALHVLATSMLTAAGVAAAIVGAADPIALPMANTGQRVVSALWFAMVLARSTLLDLYGAQLRDALVQRHAHLKAKFEKMHRRATRDALTGTLSRRSLMELLEQQQRRFELTGHAFAILLLDIDHFKQVNDRFGHPIGDEVLRTFARRAGAEMRASDRLGRYGGEEFLAVLTATEEASAAHLAAERVRDGVARHDWRRLHPDLKVTVSVGVAVCRPDEGTDQMLARADAALYAAKASGRDCVRMG